MVPRHEILSQEEVETLFTTYHVSPQNLPIILVGDAALAGLDAKMGDIVRITRSSPTAGTAVYYRRVAYE
jgi:DNA-directed RNA polymerase subunit H